MALTAITFVFVILLTLLFPIRMGAIGIWAIFFHLFTA